MRLKVTLDHPSPFFLPWRYPELLRGAFYTALRRWEPELAEAMHDQGLTAGSRRYKPFTYSWLRPRAAQRQPGGLLMQPPVWWWVSSPLLQIVEAVAGFLLTKGTINLGSVNLTVVQVEVEAMPPLKPPLVVETLSPIVASTGVEQGGRLRKVFLEPWQEEFHRVLSQNLINKARALGHAISGDTKVRLEPLKGVRSRLVTVNDIAVRGFEGRFRASGDTLLLRIGYETGFGERNAQGFGMVQLTQEERSCMSS